MHPNACIIHTSVVGGEKISSEPKYKTIRMKEEDYIKLKELQAYIRRKGTDSLDLEELRRQNIVDVPEEDSKGAGGELALGALLGLGTAALAYLIWKNSQGK